MSLHYSLNGTCFVPSQSLVRSRHSCRPYLSPIAARRPGKGSVAREFGAGGFQAEWTRRKAITHSLKFIESLWTSNRCVFETLRKLEVQNGIQLGAQILGSPFAHWLHTSECFVGLSPFSFFLFSGFQGFRQFLISFTPEFPSFFRFLFSEVFGVQLTGCVQFP